MPSSPHPPFLRRLRRLLLLVGLTALGTASSAAADTITSTNWSGYAAHRNGVHFRSVTATWREPAGLCTAGQRTYSAFWVGIGGYSLTAPALEQIGTELDCTAGGRRSISAWYELVPAASHTVPLTISAGDLIAARVTVNGHRVTVSLSDRTRHRAFTRTTVVGTVDDTSAEWIAEAPSDCTSDTSCTTLPLADFQAIAFGGARALTTGGRSGAIRSSLWSTTELLLGYRARGGSFVPVANAAHAAPTALGAGGTAFAVFSWPAAMAQSAAETRRTSPSGGGTRR